jgi:uncharacterized protein (TIGR03085 family)
MSTRVSSHQRPRDQRTALCDALDAVEPGAPTLCEGWTAHDIAAHVWVRENEWLQVAPALLRGRRDRIDELRNRVMRERSYSDLVAVLRLGPQGLSPFRLPGAEAAANGIEFFVHCEDVRRGRGVNTPRERDAALENQIWRRLPMLARFGLRRCPVAVWLERDIGDGEPARIGHGPDIVTLSGPPTEILLYLWGRRAAANVDVIGEPASVSTLEKSVLGI